MLKENKRIQIMKGSKNRRGFHTSKSYISFSLHINKREILMHYDNKEILKILSLVVLYVLSIILI